MKLRIVVISGEGGRKDGEDWAVSIYCFLKKQYNRSKIKKKKKMEKENVACSLKMSYGERWEIGSSLREIKHNGNIYLVFLICPKTRVHL